MAYRNNVDGVTYQFDDLRTLLAKASPERSGDQLAGLAADSAVERIAAQAALSEIPLKTFLNDAVIPYEVDDVTRLILDTHDAEAFAPVSHLSVGDFRNWLLGYEVDARVLRTLAPGLNVKSLPGFAIRLDCVVACPRACNPITRRMIPRVSRPVSSTGCSMAVVMRSSVSIPPAIICPPSRAYYT